MNYPDLSNILANPTAPPTSAPTAPPILAPTAPTAPSAPSSYIPGSVIHSQQPIGGYPQLPPGYPQLNTYRTEPPQIQRIQPIQPSRPTNQPDRTQVVPTRDRSNNSDDYSNLYDSILKQISYSLISHRYITSEWSNKDGKYETYVWFNKMFLSKITIIFTNEENDFILPHTANVFITTHHLSNTRGWEILENNNKYTYQISVKLNENNVLYSLCKDIYRIITPKYLIPKRKMTFWNLLDGSYFVKNY